MLMEQVGAFAREVVAPAAKHHDETGEFPASQVKQMGEMGLMGMMVSEEFGGAGLDVVSYAMCMEEISAACASTGVIMSVNNSLVCWPIDAFGTTEQKKKWLTPLARGEKLGCFALSEPGAGSDPGGLKLTATKVDGGYKLRGTKNWITNGRESDVAIVFATVDVTKGYKGVTAFIVDTKSKGFSVAKLEDKLGINSSSTEQLFFDECMVPADGILDVRGCDDEGGIRDGFSRPRPSDR